MFKLSEILRFAFTNELLRLVGVTTGLNLIGQVIRSAMGAEGALPFAIQIVLSVVLADRVVSGKDRWRQRWGAIIRLAGQHWAALAKLAALVTIMVIAAEQRTTPAIPLVKHVYSLVSSIAPFIVGFVLAAKVVRHGFINGNSIEPGHIVMDVAWAATAYMTVLALIGQAGDDAYTWVLDNPKGTAVLMATVVLTSLITRTMRSTPNTGDPSVSFAKGTPAHAVMRAPNEPTKRDLRYIAAHEAGHALAYAALGYVPAGMRVVGRPENGQRGVLGHVTGVSTPHRLEKTDLLEWQMLVLLSGKQGEIAMFGDTTLGSSNDHSRWIDCAREYLANQNQKLFYGNPRNQFEHDYDRRQIENLLDSQRRIVTDLFTMNPVVFKELYQAVLEKGVLEQDDLVTLLSDVNLPSEFARPNGPVHEMK